jgi:competence protein ComEA
VIRTLAGTLLAVALLASPVVAQQRAPAPAAAQSDLIDINSATADQLQVLPGIGPARARDIIAGRPYRGKDELVRRSIIPQGVYDNIQARIIARQSR